MKNIETLHPYFSDLEEQDKYSGVVLITQGEKELYSSAFGYANRGWKIKNTLDVRFDTASMTKLFTAVGILQLIDQKKLSFETSATKFLGLTGTNIADEVNVYHLLTHTSGIGDDCEEEAGERYEDLWKTKPNYSVRKTEDFLPQFVHKQPNFAPGEGCRYCNCGYILLGMMIEKVTGMEYREYIQKNIFEKAGMIHCAFLDMEQVNELTAEGSDPVTDEDGNILYWKRNIYSYPPIGSPDSGAYVTAGDMNLFLRALKAGKLLSEESTRALFTPQVDYEEYDDCKIKYGYCLWFRINQDGKVIFCEKEGINVGVSGLMRYYPDYDILVVLLSNMEEGVWEPVRKIHELIIE